MWHDHDMWHDHVTWPFGMPFWPCGMPFWEHTTWLGLLYQQNIVQSKYFTKAVLIHLMHEKQQNIIKLWYKKIIKCLIGAWGSDPTQASCNAACNPTGGVWPLPITRGYTHHSIICFSLSINQSNAICYLNLNLHS